MYVSIATAISRPAHRLPHSESKGHYLLVHSLHGMLLLHPASASKPEMTSADVCAVVSVQATEPSLVTPHVLALACMQSRLC